MSFYLKLKEAYLFYKYILPAKGSNSDFHKKTVAIFTTPRSGSTWLTELIKSTGNYSIIWEPLFKYRKYKINFLNPFAYPEIHKINFAWNQPIPEKEHWNEAKFFFDNLIKQEIINLKLYRFNNFKNIKDSNGIILKFCFGNLLLPWFVNNFNVKTILFIRHPAAVVLSQLKRWGYKQNYSQYKIVDFKYNSIYLKYKSIFNKVSSPEEYLAAEWALTNVYPVKHKFNNRKWLTVAYENLFIKPEYELDRISKFLNVTFNETIYSTLNKPSFTTDVPENFNKEIQLGKWKNELSADQISKIFDILELFGVDFYTKDVRPVNSIIYNEL